MATDSTKQILILAGLAAGAVGLVKYVNSRAHGKRKRTCDCQHRTELEMAMRDLELADAIEAQGEHVPW